MSGTLSRVCPHAIGWLNARFTDRCGKVFLAFSVLPIAAPAIRGNATGHVRECGEARPGMQRSPSGTVILMTLSIDIIKVTM